MNLKPCTANAIRNNFVFFEPVAAATADLVSLDKCVLCSSPSQGVSEEVSPLVGDTIQTYRQELGLMAGVNCDGCGLHQAKPVAVKTS